MNFNYIYQVSKPRTELYIIISMQNNAVRSVDYMCQFGPYIILGLVRRFGPWVRSGPVRKLYHTRVYAFPHIGHCVCTRLSFETHTHSHSHERIHCCVYCTTYTYMTSQIRLHRIVWPWHLKNWVQVHGDPDNISKTTTNNLINCACASWPTQMLLRKNPPKKKLFGGD